MAYFPFFMDIQNKNILIVGGGKIAFRKLKLVYEFGAFVSVVAPKLCDEIVRMEQKDKETSDYGQQRLQLYCREFKAEDIQRADFVIAATDHSGLNTRISELCKNNNILVNVVDVKEECSFIVPAIIKQEELVIAITTGGKSPAMAAEIKKELKEVLPEYYGELVELLGEYRDIIKAEIPNVNDRLPLYRELIQLAKQKKRVLSIEETDNAIVNFKIKTTKKYYKNN